MVDKYNVIVPRAPRVPIVLSIPHCGTSFPDEIRDEYIPELIKAPDDTDWFVDQLYSFAPTLGITVISAVYSRWVIDLNRHPESKPLYDDGRIITDLCPVTTFLGQPVYKNGREKVSDDEIRRRKELYFNPYHAALSKVIADMLSEFGVVLIWDCHSIRQHVPTIHNEKFPDLILGSADESSASRELTESALDSLRSGDYRVEHNKPFKGGFITRHYGRPREKQHALQLEMSKINYMDDSETSYNPERAAKVEEILYNTLSRLANVLISLKD